MNYFRQIDINTSSTIKFLRFPMAVVIILLHSSFEYEIIDGKSIFKGWNAPLYHHLDYVFVKNICNIAVPLFFLISGFLFFKEGELSLNLYKCKIKKRIKSLLFPYMIWNIIICLFYLCVQNLVPSMNSGRNKLILDYNIHDFIMMFWSMSYIKEGGMNGPMDTPLWFIRDLMVMMVLSPLIFFLIKKTKLLLPVLSLLLYVSGLWIGVPGFSSVALAFFGLGAYFAISHFDFTLFSKTNARSFTISYILLLILVVVMNDNDMEFCWIKNFLVILGVFSSIGWAAWLTGNLYFKISTFLTSSTFFVFASHCEILKVFIRLSSRIGIQNDLYFCLMYFVCPLLALSLVLFIYKFLQIYLPSVASVLSGGR